MNERHTVNVRCSFCGNFQAEVKKMIVGPGVAICDECIGLCNDIIVEDADRGSDLQDALLIRVERHGHALARLEELSHRLRDSMPPRIRKAIEGVQGASSELRVAVADALPEVPEVIEGDPRARPARPSIEVRKHWPVLSSLITRMATLLSRPDELPDDLPRAQQVSLQAATIGLADLVAFLGPHGGKRGPATCAPQD